MEGMASNDSPELPELLRKRGIDPLSCSVCGGNDWAGFYDVAIPVIQGQDPESGAIEGIPSSGAPGSIQAVALSCAKCGHLLLFDREIVQD